MRVLELCPFVHLILVFHQTQLRVMFDLTQEKNSCFVVRCIHIGEDLVELHVDIIFGHSEY